MTGIITAGLVVAGGTLLSANMASNAASANTKAGRALQKYTNTMTQLSHGLSQNAITTNELLSMDAFARQGFELRKESMFATSQVEAAAGAAGVKGRSVNLAVRQTIGNAANREAERQEAFRTTMLEVDTQRTGTAMAAAMQKDYSHIPKPNSASYYVNAVTDIAGQYIGMQSAGAFGGAKGSPKGGAKGGK